MHNGTSAAQKFVSLTPAESCIACLAGPGGVVTMRFPVSCKHALPIWLQPEHDLQDASELLNFIRKQPRGCPTQQLLDSYKGVEDDLKVGLGFGYSAETFAFCTLQQGFPDELGQHKSCLKQAPAGQHGGLRLHLPSTAVAGTQLQQGECAVAKQH